MRFQPFLEQLRGRFTLIAVGIQIVNLTRIIFPGSPEPLFTQEAYGKLRQRAKIQNGFCREGSQLRCQHLCIVLIGTDNAGEMLAIQGAIGAQEPIVQLAALSAVTSHVGLIATVTTEHAAPVITPGRLDAVTASLPAGAHAPGERLSAQTSMVANTQKAFDLSNARFKSGVDNYLSVLDAQRSLYTAQQTLINLRLAEQQNRVTLWKVLGGQEQVTPAS